MRKGCSIFLIFILIASLSTSSFVEIAFAERNSVFHVISDAIKYPFHSAAKTVGWEGTMDRSPRYNDEPSDIRPSFLTNLMCKIIQADIEKVTGKPPLGKPTMCDKNYLAQFFQ